jgi:hypothetical protein
MHHAPKANAKEQQIAFLCGLVYIRGVSFFVSVVSFSFLILFFLKAFGADGRGTLAVAGTHTEAPPLFPFPTPTHHL